MDDKGLVAAREYPGCFNDNEVRQYLGQPSRDAQNHADKLQGEGQEVTPKNHWLRGCICAPLHVRCAGSGISCSQKTRIHEPPGPSDEWNDIDITLDELRAASTSKCWFCAVLYASFSSMPSWDPAVPLPSRGWITISSRNDGLYMSTRDVREYPLPEPSVVLYIDGNIGMQHHPVRVPESEVYPGCAISALLSLPSTSGSEAR